MENIEKKEPPQESVINVNWTIVEGSPSVNIMLRLDVPGVTVSMIQGVGLTANLNLAVQAAYTLGLLLTDKAEAAARKAGVVLNTKLSHESN